MVFGLPAKRMKNVLKEYVKKLSDDGLKFINLRLSQRVGGDVAEAVEFLQQHPEMDRWLASAGSASDFFDMVDLVDATVQQEVRRRSTHEQKEQKGKG